MNDTEEEEEAAGGIIGDEWGTGTVRGSDLAISKRLRE